MSRSTSALIYLSLAICVSYCSAADWPAYMNGRDRAGATTDTLPRELELKWAYSSPAPPELAWEGPRADPIEGKEMRHRVSFDNVLNVAVAKGKLYFGSSVDNKLNCVDAATGVTTWEYFTEGPIRLAPTIDDGRVYVGSDDGHVYCLNVDDGSEVWKMRVGPNDERLLARGRMISRWPIRTGVLVDDGIAYFGAGVIPHETVFLCAADAKTGKLLWKNDQISQEDAGRNPLSPQGYLLASDKQLFVPSGRSLPAAFEKKTGEQDYQRTHSWRSTAGGVVGGSKALLGDGQIYSAGEHHFLALNQETGGVGYAFIQGYQLALSGDKGYVATGKKIVGLDRAKHAKATVERQALTLKQTALSRKRSSMKAAEYREQAAELQEKISKLSAVGSLWETASDCESALIVSKNLVVAGGEGKVQALDVGTGDIVWSTKVDGKAGGLAIADGRLFVSTESGKIYSFAAPSAKPDVDSPATYPQEFVKAPYTKDDLTDMYTSAAKEIAAATKKNGEHFCLIVGAGEGRLAFELARQTKWRIYGIEKDAKKLATAREKLSSAGLYGNRITIFHGDPAKMPFSNYFADVITSDTMLIDGELPSTSTQIARRVKPVGGMVCFVAPAGAPAAKSGLNAESIADFVKQVNVTIGGELTAGERVATLTRGALPGAGSWSHQYGNAANTAMSKDERVKGGMGVLWYGDPGPSKMINRHEAAAAPLSTNGRMFIQGIASIMCYDAYNGRFLWEYANPGAIRTGVFNNEEASNIAASDDALFIAVNDTCTMLDAETGKVLHEFKTPPSKDKLPRAWGYVAVQDGVLFGTSTLRTELEKHLRRRGLQLKSKTDALFAIDPATGKQKWVYRGDNIMHVTIAIGNERVFFIDSTITPEERAALLRQDKTELKNLSEEEAKKKEAELKAMDVRRAIALDLETGKELWREAVDVTDCSRVGIGGGQLTLMYQDNHVVICGANANGHYWRQFLSGQFDKRRLVVLDAKSGEHLWHKDANYRHRPIIVEDQIFAEPFAFDLHSGEEKKREHPLTGEQTAWQFSRPGHHCGMITATPNMLFFRSGFTGYYDLYSDSGTSHFAGHRLGCWINAIPGNGLLMIPEASAGCVCQFSIASTIVMEPREDRETWKIYSATGASTPVKRLALNLGAPGDRKDDFGKLWLGYPRPKTVGRLEYVLKVGTSFEGNGKFFATNSEAAEPVNAKTSWVHDSGAKTLNRCTIPLLGKDDPSAKYTVKLHFIDMGDEKAGEELLEIRMQGQDVAEKLNVAEDAAKNGVSVQTYKNVDVTDDLTIDIFYSGDHRSAVTAVEVERQ